MIKKSNRRIALVVSENVHELLKHIAENEERSLSYVAAELLKVGLSVFLKETQKEEKEDVSN